MPQIRKTVALALGLLVTSVAVALPPKYIATALPALNPTIGFYAKGINQTGTVVGISFDNVGQNQAELWTPGGMQNLGTLGAEYASALAINDLGDIVGNSKLKTTAFHAFKYTANQMIDLGGFDPKLNSYAYGINAKGVVVGAAYTEVGNSRAVFWDASGIHDMGLIKGATDAAAYGISNAGRICGETTIDNLGAAHAFVWSGGKYKFIVPKSVASSARAINNAAHVTGVFATDNGYHAFYYNGISATDIGTLGGHSSLGLAINSANHVVGQAANAQENDRAFVWMDGTMYDLNACLSKPISVPLVSATGINSKGWIIAVDAFGKSYRLRRIQ